MSDTRITLGDFVFENLEIPAFTNFGGEQRLVVHELVGGQRVIDAMGSSNADITWGGLMTGSDALSRALQLDAIRAAGKPVVFTLFNLRYYVLIANFDPKIQRYYQVEYTITLKVVQDYNQASGALSILGFSDSIIGDFATANQIAGLINNPTLNSAMASVNTAISSVSSFANAPVASLSSINSSIGGALGIVSSQLTSSHVRLFGS